MSVESRGAPLRNCIENAWAQIGVQLRRRYDNASESFPSSVIADMAGFGPKEYFETEPASRQPVKVKF